MRLDVATNRIIPCKFVYGLITLLFGAIFLHAEQWPLRTYTTADGLVGDWIHRIVQDSRGFLWFCTRSGLSRFDGYQFTNYTSEDGLPHHTVTDLLETRYGVYWIATRGGLCQFDPLGNYATETHAQPGSDRLHPAGKPLHDAQTRFRRHPLSADDKGQSVQALLEDRSGTVWCGAERGLYRLERVGNGWTSYVVDLRHAAGGSSDVGVTALVEDRLGNLWIGTVKGLYRRRPDGHIDHYTQDNGLPDDTIRLLLPDRSGRLWVGTDFALTAMAIGSNDGSVQYLRSYTTAEGLPGRLRSMFQSSDGRIWVGTLRGLCQFLEQAANGQHFKHYTTVQGLWGVSFEAITQDRTGHLWLSTEGGGLRRLALNGLVMYNQEDGLGYIRVRSIFENQEGDLCMLSGPSSIYRLDDTRFTEVRLNVPPPVLGWNQSVFQDHTGEWWVPTGVGLYRFPKVHRLEELARIRPQAVYTTREGLTGDVVSLLFEDSRGDLWIGTGGLPEKGLLPAQAGVTRWDRRRGTFHQYSEAQGLPLKEKSVVTAFCEDGAGNVWIGLGWAGLARYREGRFQIFSIRNGWPVGYVRQLYRDQAGRLWVATTDAGVLLIKDPTADSPPFRQYTIAHGLSSNVIECFTEDRWGDLYIATGHGVDRLHPDTGHITHYGATNGLGPKGQVRVAFRDRKHTLWFGSMQGLARFVPASPVAEPPSPAVLAPILIRALHVNGVPYPISELGQVEVSSIELQTDQNQIQIDFVALNLATDERLRYQHRLLNTDHDWSMPAEERTIRFMNLAPGTYRFMVRAVSSDRKMSPQPATVSFTILRPVWQRPWFLALAVLAGGLLLYALHRYRLAQRLALERVRTRIASDLHDDIGASLSGIALTSDAVRQQIQAAYPDSAVLLSEAGKSARHLADTMSDIVWAIDPRRDDLLNLTSRIRQAATEVLDAKGIAWTFETPGDLESVRLTPDQRRHLLLIFKEAVHNSVRHSDATLVRMTIRLAGGQLWGAVEDNGRGFDPMTPTAGSGSGLQNMQDRAAQLGGHLSVTVTPGGTRLSLQVPLKERKE